MKKIDIAAVWDDEAKVWFAKSDDVPGLAIEASTMEKLIKRLKIAVPELLELNGHATCDEIPFEIHGQRSGIMRTC